jgi:hypothetical protein
MSDERMDLNAPSHGGVQSPLDAIAIEAEDDQLDALPGLFDRRDQWRHAVSRLNQELHACLPTFGHGVDIAQNQRPTAEGELSVLKQLRQRFEQHGR